MPPFRLTRLPEIHFGEGSLSEVPGLVASLGRRLLLVTGARSFRGSARASELRTALKDRGVRLEECIVEDEPSPALVDRVVDELGGRGIDVVAGIGGGSALDAAKAIAGLLPRGNSVMDHLEGVGRGVPYHGPALPWVAVPTTAGTGSEATKNAVLGEAGPRGFKKSFRHEALVARHAVVDPSLLASCPARLVAADGMDALTQLLESYLSTRAQPVTDALAESGLRALGEGLLPWFEERGDLAAARSRMAYAALLSGITLSQTGLGSVHGIAAAVGARVSAPHGEICGTLVAEATRVNVEALHALDPAHPALERYARVLAILDPGAAPTKDGPRALVDLLRAWTARLGIPRLGRYGLAPDDVEGIVAGSRGSSMRTNPLSLTDEQIAEVVAARL